MFNVELACSRKTIVSFNSPVTGKEIRQELQRIESTDFYVTHNGKLLHDDDVLFSGTATVVPRLRGGKGGFGSMLRAIGAQIEKTTNREACRDLSGRRLRDINEEKRLKSWLDKQSTREEEAAEKKKKKLKKLCAEPRHEFQDKQYEENRSNLARNVEDAVEEGFKAAAAAAAVDDSSAASPSTSCTKRKSNENDAVKKKKKKIQTLLDDFDEDIDTDELDTSDSSSDESESNDSKKSIIVKSASESETLFDSNQTQTFKEETLNPITV